MPPRLGVEGGEVVVASVLGEVELVQAFKFRQFRVEGMYLNKISTHGAGVHVAMLLDGGEPHNSPYGIHGSVHSFRLHVS